MPTQQDLSLYQGDDWAATVTVTELDLTPADLTGYTAQAQIRSGIADQQPVVAAEISCTIQLPNFILLYLPHTQTLKLTGSTCYWDLQLASPQNQILTILAGRVGVAQEVTREGLAVMRRGA